MAIKEKGQNLRELYESCGRDAFMGKMRELLEAGPGAEGLKPEDFSIRELWEAMVGPVERTLGANRGVSTLNFLDLQEAVDSTAFPSAVGLLVARKVTEAYNAPGFIGNELVTVMPSRQASCRSSRVPVQNASLFV